MDLFWISAWSFTSFTRTSPCVTLKIKLTFFPPLHYLLRWPGAWFTCCALNYMWRPLTGTFFFHEFQFAVDVVWDVAEERWEPCEIGSIIHRRRWRCDNVDIKFIPSQKGKLRMCGKEKVVGKLDFTRISILLESFIISLETWINQVNCPRSRHECVSQEQVEVMLSEFLECS